MRNTDMQQRNVLQLTRVACTHECARAIKQGNVRIGMPLALPGDLYVRAKSHMW